MVLRLLVLALLATATVGCKSVEIQNGEVPAEYLYLAKKFEGQYEGKFNGIAGQLLVRLEGNKPVVEFSNSTGSDILNSGCESSIGNLKTVHLKGTKENPQIDSAVFVFNPGKCALQVQGREITFDFENDYTKIESVILKERRMERQCTRDSGAPPHVPPREVCRYEERPILLWGKFYR